MIIPNQNCDGIDQENKFKTTNSKTYKERLTPDGNQDLTVSPILVSSAKYSSQSSQSDKRKAP